MSDLTVGEWLEKIASDEGRRKDYHSICRPIFRKLLADREALVRYLRAKEAMNEALNKPIPAGLLPLVREQDSAYFALSQDLRDEIQTENTPTISNTR